MDVNTTLWGTIPIPEVGEPHKMLNEQEMEVAMNAMETEPHELETEDEENSLEIECDRLSLVPVECSQMDPIVLNTIELIQYAKHVSELTDRIYAENENLSTEIKKLTQIPPLLETKSDNFDRPPDDESDFTLGRGSAPFPLSHRARNQILYKSVATLAALRGYDLSSSTALEVLTSVTSDLMSKICRLLKLTVDSSPPSSDNLTCLERVLHQMTLGTLRSFKYFYQTEVLDYQKTMRLKCEKLVEELHIANEAAISKLLKQDQMSNGQSFEMDFKQDDDDIPLLHFPASEDGNDGNGFQSSLEHGFQMLHNLEQEQLQMGNADLERDVNIVINHQAARKFVKRQ